MAALSPLSNPVFRHLFAAQVFSLVGTGMSTIALALLAWQLDPGNAGLILGVALGIKMVAYLVVAPVAGALAHKLPAKQWLITLDLSRAGILALFPLIDASWQMFLLILVLNICAAGFTPIYQSLIPEVVSSNQEYTRALSLSRLAMELENLFSPLLAAVLLLMLPFPILFILNAVGLLASAFLVLTTQLLTHHQDEHADGLLRRIGFGTRAYLATPRLRGLLALHLVIAAGGAMIYVNTVVYVRDALQLPEQWVAYAMAGLGLGAIIGALLLPRLGERFNDRSIMLSGGLLMVVSMVMGTALPGFFGLMVLWTLMGLATSLALTPAGQVITRSCKETDRKDFFAANFALSHGLWLITYPLAGLLGNIGVATDALPLAFAALGTIGLIGLVIAFRSWPAEEETELWHEHAAQEHEHLHIHDEHHQHEHEGWEGPEPHRHSHRHGNLKHRHSYTIDEHHSLWP